MPTYVGPWITPTTTRFVELNGASVTQPPSRYITLYQGDTWDDARNGSGATTAGPFQSLAAWNAGGHEVLHYENFPSFTRYTVGQSWAWLPISSIAPANFPPYVDVTVPPHVASIEYETPYGAPPATAGVRVTAVTGGGNINLPAALMDIYQVPTGFAGTTPTYEFFTPAGLTSLAAYKLGSVDSTTGATFTGIDVASTDTIVFMIASAGQTATPFPYATPDPSGFQQFAELFPAVEYIGPRFRFVYNILPPLRQFPRDDFLGGSPRQGHRNGSTSVQASTRQGWRGSYR